MHHRMLISLCHMDLQNSKSRREIVPKEKGIIETVFETRKPVKIEGSYMFSNPSTSFSTSHTLIQLVVDPIQTIMGFTHRNYRESEYIQKADKNK